MKWDRENAMSHVHSALSVHGSSISLDLKEEGNKKYLLKYTTVRQRLNRHCTALPRASNFSQEVALVYSPVVMLNRITAKSRVTEGMLCRKTRKFINLSLDGSSVGA